MPPAPAGETETAQQPDERELDLGRERDRAVDVGRLRARPATKQWTALGAVP